MVLFGASGHGKVIIDILELNGTKEIKIWDDAPKGTLSGYNVSLPDFNDNDALASVTISIGDNTNRKKVAERFPQQTKFHTAIHPSATISKTVKVDDGTVIMAGVSINPDTSIGKHGIINTNASIDHDCLIGDYVHISPNVALCGNVTIGEGTHIGAASVVIPGKTIGKWCTIGAGTVIINDVPDYATVVGNPGRIIKTSTKG
jgi:acetyltransferase EpsM